MSRHPMPPREDETLDQRIARKFGVPLACVAVVLTCCLAAVLLWGVLASGWRAMWFPVVGR